MRRVVARQMRVGLGITEIVDGDDLDFAAALTFVERAQDVATDTAIAVDCYFDGHDASLGRPDDDVEN